VASHDDFMAEWHALLACPHCGRRLSGSDRVLACEAGHAFDIAREGYVNLLEGGARPGTADTPAMVAARTAFLAGGHFAPLDAALADAAAIGAGGCIVDVGAGTGEHLAAVLDRLPGRTGLALDVSKYAARRAARAHPRIGAVVCDAWGTLPVRSGVAAVVMSVFAPRNPSEFARMLAPGGTLVVATPTPAHLGELIGPLGMVTVDPRKEERLETAFAGLFRRECTRTVERALSLSRTDAVAVALMGPSAHHLSAGEAQERAERLAEPIVATMSVAVSTWQLEEVPSR